MILIIKHYKNNNDNSNNNNNNNNNNSNNNNFKRWWPLSVAQSTNRHIALHKRTGGMTNAETRHRYADSPSSRR